MVRLNFGSELEVESKQSIIQDFPIKLGTNNLNRCKLSLFTDLVTILLYGTCKEALPKQITKRNRGK